MATGYYTEGKIDPLTNTNIGGGTFVPTSPTSDIAKYFPKVGDSTTTPVKAGDIGTTGSPNLPNPPIANTSSGLVAGNNAGLANPAFGVSVDPKGGLIYNQPQAPEPAKTTTQDSSSGFMDNLKTYLGLQKAPPSSADLYNSLPEKTAFEDAQKSVKDLTAQLNGIVARGNADKLSLSGQGLFGGALQGRNAQLDREIAIEALPVQAQLAAAQGNLQLAQSHLDTIFKFRSEDATNQYNYQTKLIDSVFEFANKAEERKLADLKATSASNLSQVNNALNFAQSLSTEATKNGQVAVASALTKLVPPDPSSKTFKEDLVKYNNAVSSLQNQITASSKDTVPTIKSINGVDMQWNPTKGQWETPTATKDTAGVSLPLARAQENVTQISELLNDQNIRTAVGPTGIARIIGRGYDTATGGRQNFIASVEQIRSNLNLEALIGAKARGATFGALSDQELRVLASSASKIGSWAKKDSDGNVVSYRASEKDFKKELDKINNFAKLDYILRGGDPTDVGAQMQSDGTIWTKNSDGTLTQIK